MGYNDDLAKKRDGSYILKHKTKKAKEDMKALTRAANLEVLDPLAAEANPAAKALAGVTGDLQVLIPVEGLVDIVALRSRLEKDVVKAEKDITSLSGRLANQSFLDKAPLEVVSECKLNLAEAQAQADLARKRLLELS